MNNKRETELTRMWEYTAVYWPDDDGDAQIIVPVTQVMADDEVTVRVIAARAVTLNEGESIKNVDILVRPF